MQKKNRQNLNILAIYKEQFKKSPFQWIDNTAGKNDKKKKMAHSPQSPGLRPGALNGLAKLRVDTDLLPFILHFALVDGHWL